jgi:hypothetical protein
MPSIADRVKETTTTTGTGTVSLDGAVTGFRAFSSAFTTGTVVYYCITDGTNWEVGYGAVTTGTPWTLARTTVLASSNAGSLVSFGAGTKDVFCTAPAAVNIPSITGNALKVLRANAAETGLEYVTITQDWIAEKSSNYTAVNGDRIPCNTSAGAFSITLPATPSAGNQIELTDSGGTFATNHLTIARNGSTIMGLSEDMTVSTNNIGFGLVYTGSTWRIF